MQADVQYSGALLKGLVELATHGHGSHGFPENRVVEEAEGEGEGG